MPQEVKFIEHILEKRWLSHVLFWLSSLPIFLIYGMGFNLPVIVGLIIKGFFLPVQIAATYFLIYYQIPTFLYTHKYVRFFISLFFSAFLHYSL